MYSPTGSNPSSPPSPLYLSSALDNIRIVDGSFSWSKADDPTLRRWGGPRLTFLFENIRLNVLARFAYLFVCLSISLSVSVFVYDLSVCLSVCVWQPQSHEVWYSPVVMAPEVCNFTTVISVHQTMIYWPDKGCWHCQSKQFKTPNFWFWIWRDFERILPRLVHLLPHPGQTFATWLWFRFMLLP